MGLFSLIRKAGFVHLLSIFRERRHGLWIQCVIDSIAQPPTPHTRKVFRIEGVSIDLVILPRFGSIVVVIAPRTVVPTFRRRVRRQGSMASLVLTSIAVPTWCLGHSGRGESEHQSQSHNHDNNSTTHLSSPFVTICC